MRWQDEVAEANAVAPQMFKSLAGRGHSAFSSNHQQVGGMYGRGRAVWSTGFALAAMCI